MTGIVRAQDGTDNGNPDRASLDHCRCCLGSDPANADDRDPGQGSSPSDRLQPDRLARVVLGNRAENRADAEVVGAVITRLGRLLVSLGGVADDEVVAGQAAGVTHGEIVYAKVDAAGARGQGKVEAVVDDEEGACLVAAPCELSRKSKSFAIGKPFRPQLDAGDAPGERGLDVVDETALRLIGVGDKVDGKVSNEG
jgi:hypothetical protein